MIVNVDIIVKKKDLSIVSDIQKSAAVLFTLLLSFILESTSESNSDFLPAKHHRAGVVHVSASPILFLSSRRVCKKTPTQRNMHMSATKATVNQDEDESRMPA